MSLVKSSVVKSTLISSTLVKTDLFNSSAAGGLGTPRIIDFFATNTTSVFVDWNPVTDATGYEVEYSVDDGNTWLPA